MPKIILQTWEGGTRVPAFVHAPGRLSPTTIDSMVHISDWTPTLMSAVGGSIEPGLDGINMWTTLQGGPALRDQVPININPLCQGYVLAQLYLFEKPDLLP